MPLPVPDLSLSHGQMAWALCYGQEPDQRLRDQLRYLRQLGIPKTASERGAGSGNRICYDFYDLVETGLGVMGLMRGSKPRDIAAVLVDRREALRQVYAQAWAELPEIVLTYEPLLGERIVFNPFAGETWTSAASSARRQWLQQYGRAPDFRRTWPLQDALQQIHRTVVASDDAGTARMLSDLELALQLNLLPGPH